VLARRKEGAMSFYSVADETVVALCRSACVQLAAAEEEPAPSARVLRRFMPGT
jgi:hypothetical protein